MYNDEIYQLNTATWRLIYTLIRFKAVSDNVNDWDFIDKRDLEQAVILSCKRHHLKQEKKKEDYKKVENHWQNTLYAPSNDWWQTCEITVSKVYVDEYRYDDRELIMMEQQELATLGHRHQFHQSDQVPNTFGPRCRCQSLGAFSIDSS